MMKACWIWYPGDFEIYHGMLQNFQREERGYGWPAYWKMDDWRKNVFFYRTEAILRNVLLNDAVPAITTPYFKFFELDMWGKLGRLDILWASLHDYWGGMVAEGATTFWEQYDPRDEGNAHYAVYGDPFGKSLCHAWAASPIYLLGRYFLGVKPLTPGYETFSVQARLEYFSTLRCTVPVRNGEVAITCENGCCSVVSSREGGTLVLDGKVAPLMPVNKATAEVLL